MSLGSNVADPKKHISGKLALNCQIILIGILWAQFLRKLPKEQDRPETRPVDGGSARRVQTAVKGIGISRTALRQERRLEQRGADEVAATKGWFGAELF